MQFCNERMIGTDAENCFFIVDYVRLVVRDDILLVDNFHSHYFSEASYHVYFGEASCTNTLNNLKVFQVIVIFNFCMFTTNDIKLYFYISIMARVSHLLFFQQLNQLFYFKFSQSQYIININVGTFHIHHVIFDLIMNETDQVLNFCLTIEMKMNS